MWTGAAPVVCSPADKQIGQLVGHGAGQFLRIDDGDRTAVIAGHVMADADGEQLDRRAGLDLAITSRRCFSR
jgi:hypothetical protein